MERFSFPSCMQFVESLKTVSLETLRIVAVGQGSMLDAAEKWARDNRAYWPAQADAILAVSLEVRARL